METTLLDLSYLYEISDNDNKYIYDILMLFMDTVPNQLQKLEELVFSNDTLTTESWLAIQKQAHALKSSVLFVKIRNLYEGFYSLETLARNQHDRTEMQNTLKTILGQYIKAIPLIQTELERCKS